MIEFCVPFAVVGDPSSEAIDSKRQSASNGSTATNFDKRAYDPIDDVDKVSCRPDFVVSVYPGYLIDKETHQLAPYIRIPPRTPPIFLAHASDDTMSDAEHSVVMYLALRRAGVPAELHVYAATAHDFGVRPSDHPCSTWTRACADWLRQQGLLEASSGR